MKLLLSLLAVSFLISCGGAVEEEVGGSNMKPVVGDEAAYTVETYQGENFKGKTSFTMKLKSFNKNSDKYTIEKSDNGTVLEKFEVTSKDLSEKFYPSDFIKDCREENGENVVSIVVPAGKFRACNYKDSLGTGVGTVERWAAEIPFTTVKEITVLNNGTKTVQTLVRLKKN